MSNKRGLKSASFFFDKFAIGSAAISAESRCVRWAAAFICGSDCVRNQHPRGDRIEHTSVIAGEK
jgi:hypothetical protein